MYMYIVHNPCLRVSHLIVYPLYYLRPAGFGQHHKNTEMTNVPDAQRCPHNFLKMQTIYLFLF